MREASHLPASEPHIQILGTALEILFTPAQDASLVADSSKLFKKGFFIY